MSNKVIIRIVIDAPIHRVWELWNRPEHIVHWAFASDDWEAPSAENDLRIGGRFKTRMAAKDGSSAFDFSGEYTNVEEDKLIEYKIDDGRMVIVEFKETPEGALITETFETESENAEEKQRSGWQAILSNFKKYVESHK